MKRYLLLAVLPFLLAGCYPTRIVTSTPYSGGIYAPYTTTVTVQKAKTVTTTTSVQPISEDISLHLDLQAIGAAFAQSATVKEFEELINNSSYVLSNLDLNRDGYVDYLRVLETVEGYNHVFVIQAVLGANIYQDVATLVAEVPSATKAYVQIIGDPYIYGPSYYVEPVYYTTPLIFAHLLAHAYRPWRSPWYWDCYPVHYKRPVPIHIGHYHAYVHTFMTNHLYCHTVSYPTVCHCPTYINICKIDIHNDYGTRYPERSFTVRNADLAQRVVNTSVSSPSTRVMNASVVRELNETNVRTTTTSTRSAASANSTRNASTGVSRSTNTGTVRNAATTGTTTRSASTSSARSAASTTTRSRVTNTGSSNTRISTVSPSGSKSTVTRSSSSTRSAASSSATRSTGSSTATRSSSTAGTSTRSSSTTANTTRTGSSRR